MRLELLVKWTILNFAFTELVESIMKRKLLILELQEWIERLDKETVISEESYGTERKTGITDAPSHIRRWLSDDRLKAVLRKDIKRGDTGFSRDDIDLYIQMGEFTFLSPAKQEMTAAAFVKMSADVREAIGRMIKIPAGEFFYGEGKDKKKMPLSDYELGIYPITNAEYKEFIASKSDYKTPKDWKDGTYPEGKQDHPVVNVSFFDAQAYCEWRSKKEGMTYRLPSEEEWEKAARGTDGRQYPWGDEFDKDKCNTSESGIGTTTPVNKYPDGVSPYGCFDMAGNVWEWTAIWYDEEEKNKVLRGGSWGIDRDDVRCAARIGRITGATILVSVAPGLLHFDLLLFYPFRRRRPNFF
jgi:formylglycine-generating enzyme required for sulfatase activity